MNPFATIQELRSYLTRREVQPRELVEMYQNRLRTHNPTLNCALQISDDAREISDHDVHAQPLGGIPCMIKSNICKQGVITSCGSRMLANYRAPYSATVVEKLEEAGSIIIASGNMDEFAMGASGEFSAFGATKNPYDLTRSPGGSSSGPAAAVAAGLIPWALGSETGGSVRQPAAFCGLVGLYPTYGLFSRYGLVAFGSSSDQVGPLTRTVYDNALVASALSGHDPRDGTSLPQPAQNFTKLLSGKLPENLVIGVFEEAMKGEGIDPEIHRAFLGALESLKGMGAKIRTVSVPALKYGIAVYFVTSRAEAASNLSRFDGSLFGLRAPDAKNLFDMYCTTREEGFGSEVKRRILLGNFVLSAGHRDAFYTKATHVRNLLRTQFEAVFKEVDVISSPTTSTLPFELGRESSDPLAMYMGDYFTVPTNAAGLPGISLPCGFSQTGLPIGFQFVGPRLSEHLLYQVAHAYEKHHEFYRQTPKGFNN